jgi:ATP-dependent helicase/nuclease subunit A
MDRQWNDRQAEAIASRGHSVVVSAAAGSGKTSVLTERVLRLIEAGEDIERMLIVTFTNLAAGEMKERIYRALQEAGQLKGGARLAAQAEKCAFADISTIHSFCGRLIRDHFEYAGVSPTFAVADEAQAAMLKSSALESVIEQFGAEGFFEKYAPRGGTRRIAEVVLTIYARVICQRDPEAWLAGAEAHFTDPDFIRVLFDEYRDAAMEAAEAAAQKLAERSDLWRIRGYDDIADESERQRIQMLRAVREMTVEAAYLPAVESVGVKGNGAPWRASESCTREAAGCFEALRPFEGDFGAKARAGLDATAGDAKNFIELTRSLMRAYGKAKRARNLLDYDDTIHLALKVLSVPEIARRCREKYAHVFVDEYQDVNDAQNAIISLLTRGDNDFVVGDVKQCIYMFRESNPELLVGRCQQLHGSGLVEMNVNYRSMPGVLRFINGVMRHMMTEGAGGVEYAGGHTLLPGREGEGLVQIRMAGGGEDSLSAEAAQVGAVIRELVASGFRYGEIAVLRPEVSNSGRRFARMLSDMDIPVAGGAGGEDAAFGEPGVFLNLLRVIDSPVADIPMLSVMRYEHFGFTEPELARIRAAYRPDEGADKSFCAALAAFDEASPLGGKVRRFREELAYYRRLAACLSLPDLLSRLRQLGEFCEYALTSPGARGSDAAIADFLSAVAGARPAQLRDAVAMAEHIAAKRETQAQPAADAVCLTTIHKSKGLEFRAVILTGMHKRINLSDASGGVLVGRGLGIGLEAVDPRRRVRQRTWHQQAVARAIRRERISETVRLLYVGMTRAIERLYIVGAREELRDEWLEPKCAGWQHRAVTFFDLIMPPVILACRENGEDIGELVRFSDDLSEDARREDKAQRLHALFAEARGATPARLFERYEYEADLGVPSKVSVSALKRREEPQLLRPVATEREEDITAAERGTLMHRVLQIIGLEEKSAEQVKESVSALARRGLIGEALAAHVDAEQIAAFLRSGVAARARRSRRCLFEQPFCLRMSAREAGLSQSDEAVIVQGVIDLCFLEDGCWVLVDYKTDAVKTTAGETAAKYALQLALYEKALERITHLPISEKIVFLLSAGEAVRFA